MLRSLCLLCLFLPLAAPAPAAPFGAFLQETGPLPFSLTYGGRTCAGDFPASWTTIRETRELPGNRLKRTVRWNDPDTGLEVRLEATLYRDFGAVEWVLHLTNSSENDTPILEDIHAADFPWDGADKTACELHYAEGSAEKITDFQPRSQALETGIPATFTPFGGRPSDGFLPFFNLASPSGGAVVAIGWTGQWTASFTRDGDRVHVTAGMENARFRLLPHESVRTPSVLVMPWEGNNYLAGQNRFRRLLLEHYVPRYNGAPAAPLTAASPHAAIAFEKTTEANMIEAIHNIAAHHLPVDYFWIDAGWFTSPDNNWARGVGNFEPDPARFPRGMKPVADAAHEAGLKFLLWFEPERVMPGTFLFVQHPGWLLNPPPVFPEALQYQFNDGFHLLDLARPEAASWLAETVSKAIGGVGIDAYRNDFNMYPSFYWRNGEAPDRQGIEEIKYVEALYRYFDILRTEHPQLLLDNCASGGRRIDLEMLKRALILTRSDYLWDPTGQQCHNYGLAQWLPITGIGAADVDRYKCRSGYGSHFTFAVDYYSNDESVWEAARAALEECRSLAPLFRKDFYPLTPYSIQNSDWMAWQFHDPDRHTGLIQAFRRNDCPDARLQCVPQGLDPSVDYILTNLDSRESMRAAGRKLLDAGFTITLPEAPAAAIYTYERAAPP